MRILVLGGTAWLGFEIAANAVDRGHEVVCAARGVSGAVPPGARLVAVDRDDPQALDALAAERWDAVLDVARQPGHVRRSTTALADATPWYGFVSSGSVYADLSTPGGGESDAIVPPLEADAMEEPEQYGAAKSACEAAVGAAFPGSRRLIARAGLIGGPGDSTGRSGYWPWRFAHPGTLDTGVLVPDAPHLLTAVLDVRDLAAWLVDAAERRTGGVFDAYGDVVRFEDALLAANLAAGYAGRMVRASPEWLLAQGVAEWSGPTSLPLWIADERQTGLGCRSNRRAVEAGLTPRSLEQTFADTLVWEESRDELGIHGAGLTDEEERELLAALAAHPAP